MVLGVVVGLVRVIAGFPAVIHIFAGTVVRTVHDVHFRRDAIPGHAALLVAHQISQPEGITSLEPADYTEERGGFDAGVPDVSVRPSGRVRQVEIQAGRQQAGHAGYRGEDGPVRTRGQFPAEGRIGRDEGRVHIDARPEGAGAVGRRAQAALDLDAGQQGRQRGDIDPEHLLGFGIVKGDAVQGHIDLRPLGAADGHRRIAQSGTSFVVGHHGRQQVQGHRQGLHGTGGAEGVLAHIGVCYGGVCSGTGSGNDD